VLRGAVSGATSAAPGVIEQRSDAPTWCPEVYRLLGRLDPEGEPLFAAVVAGPLGLALLGPPPDWLTTLPPGYRGRQVCYTTLGEARRLREPAFVKPADDKCFPAGVHGSGERLPRANVLPDSTPVLVAEVVGWEVEYRCFVLGRAVTTSSPYLRGGELSRAADGTWPAPRAESEAARAFAGAVLADAAVRLPPVVVLDVGAIAGRGWAGVEANAAWGSGVYRCDPAQVLPVIRRSCVATDKLTDEERRWVMDPGVLGGP
jgi:hypothetical protein